MIRIVLLIALLLSVSTATKCQVPRNIPSAGLMGWWPFSGDAEDESSYGNRGAVEGATLTRDRNGILNAAYSFNGESDYITIGNSPHFEFLRTGSFTINFFMKPLSSVTSGQESDNETAFSLGDFCENYENRGILVGVVSTNKLWYAVRGNNGFDLTANCMVQNRSLGVWQMITLVRDYGKQTRLYVNGRLEAEAQDAAGETSPFSEPRNIELGREINPCGGDNTHNFNGDIDDLGIWNRVLTQSEILGLFDCQERALVESRMFDARENVTWKSSKLRRGTTYIIEGYGQWKANAGSVNTEEDFCFTYPLPCETGKGDANTTMRIGYDIDDMLGGRNLLMPVENALNCDDHTYRYYVIGDDREVVFDFRDTPASDNTGELGVRIFECITCSASQPSDSILGYRSTETHQVVTYALRNKPELSYQWIATGGYLLGETTNHYCDVIWGYDKTGSVCCIVSDSTCTDTICVEVNINNATTGGIAGDVPTEPTMSARPNPTSDMIDISSVDATNATSYTLVDVTGRVLQQVHGQRVRMSVEDVPNGVYHLLMKNAEGTVVAMQRVVVQR